MLTWWWHAAGPSSRSFARYYRRDLSLRGHGYFMNFLRWPFLYQVPGYACLAMCCLLVFHAHACMKSLMVLGSLSAALHSRLHLIHCIFPDWHFSHSCKFFPCEVLQWLWPLHATIHRAHRSYLYLPCFSLACGLVSTCILFSSFHVSFGTRSHYALWLRCSGTSIVHDVLFVLLVWYHPVLAFFDDECPGQGTLPRSYP